jgi:hypothetical protein
MINSFFSFLLKCFTVTFNNEVTVYESKDKSHVITGDKLNDFNYLLNVANDLKIDLKTPIEKNKKELSDLVFSLEEKGATALGPALLVSIGTKLTKSNNLNT